MSDQVLRMGRVFGRVDINATADAAPSDQQQHHDDREEDRPRPKRRILLFDWIGSAAVNA